MHSTRAIKHNLRRVLETRNISITDAANLSGVSKQYLSQYLNDLDGSKRDNLLDALCVILEISPARLLDEEPFPLQLGAIPPPPAPAATVNSVPVTGLPARMLKLYKAEQYQQLLAEYRSIPPEEIKILSGRDRAEAELLIAKSLIHTHQYSPGTDLLNKSLKLFQQRQSLQPQVFIPHILDCYRYLALAAFLQGDVPKSLAFHQRLLNKVMGLHGEQLSPALLEKVRPALTNALILAKKTGNWPLAVKVYTESRDFFLSHSDEEGIKWMKQEAALSRAKAAHLLSGTDRDELTASSRGGESRDFFLENIWRIKCYLALGQQDFAALSELAGSPPSRRPRTRLFCQYLFAIVKLRTAETAEAWQELNTLQHYFYGGHALATDYYFIAHIRAEFALGRNFKQAALNHMLDSLHCARLAGDWEERLRLLDRLRQMQLGNINLEIIEHKIHTAVTQLKKYWEETS